MTDKDTEQLRAEIEAIYNCRFCDGKKKIYNIKTNKYQACPHTEVTTKLEALFQAYTKTIEREAETNAVAWAIGVIDEFHIMPHNYSNERDRFYKGVKNGLRDRFRSETGIDPAPNYPIKAELRQQQEDI